MKSSVKITVLAIMTTAAILLTGCQIMDFSLLTGKGALSTSDIVFPKDSETETNTEVNTENSELTENTEHPDNPPETQEKPSEPSTIPDEPETNTEPTEPDTSTEKEEPVNKTGLIAHKTYLFQGTAEHKALNKTIINTVEEYQKFLSTIPDYSNKENLSSEMLKDYFFVVVAPTPDKNVLEYQVDSVKNGDRFIITTLNITQETPQENDKKTVMIVAINRNDIPIIPDSTNINTLFIPIILSSPNE